jgi:leucyl-tRNA synthetase
MEYNFREIEQKWQKYWAENKIYKVEINDKPKFYVLDMFPYPSGAGLHVGHPLGYIASDIFSRYKRLCGFNVLHPMGYDAYGLPAEQYAIQTGQHPSVTTETNINRYREQLDKTGFCFDWDREVRTCDPKYYKWTQWAFIQMFNSYYCNRAQQARPISKLIEIFSRQGTCNLDLACSKPMQFTAEDWNVKSETEQQEILLNYRIAYLADTMVNWCPALGTVLANDEVSEGLSIRGGYPVEQKMMRQWSLRVSAYAQRLLTDLEKLDWSESLKETQRNWIGRSEGAEIRFYLSPDTFPCGEGQKDRFLTVFTTRADTIFGATFMVLAPESKYAVELTTKQQQQEVVQYIERTKRRTERERIADRSVTGVFTGSYAINPVNGAKIPIWISDYVLAVYGTGAIMAVPAHDSRDYAFARHFDLPVIPLIEGCDVSAESFDAKDGIMVNSGFLNGLTVTQAIEAAKKYIEDNNTGKRKVNYRLRDAIFSRQRYWGEPFPIYYKAGMPYALDENKLPLELPDVDKFLPTETGEPPLGRAKNWQTSEGYPLELNTMPGFAGSSAYYLRYMDPHNDKALVSAEANKYWQNVDLYVGGTEHATGHLIYSRFWNKFLFDLGLIVEDEPFKKLINQGMIQGRSNFVYRIKGTNTFVSAGLKDKYDITEIHADVNIVKNDILDIEKFRNWMPDFNNAEFILEDGKYICGYAVEKMSKSMYNVVNPDVIVESYGADTLRMYEMFLGPVEQSKPWDTNGIDGVHRFLRRFWSLFFDKDGNFTMPNEKANQQELKCLHKTIKKIQTDIENFSFNTSVSAFMICVNELMTLKCNKREILEPLIVILSPLAPHIAEELWRMAGNNTSVCDAEFPKYSEEFLIENTFEYPVSFNGKMRFKKELPLTFDAQQIEAAVLADSATQKWLEGKTPKKVIAVIGKIVNVVV